MATETEADWPEALATVLTCRYDMRSGRALIGLPAARHFRITYNYFANGELHTAELYSPVAIPQNTLFPIRYNPEAPADHLHAYSSVSPPNPRAALMVIAILGSALLSLAWFAILRGCR